MKQLLLSLLYFFSFFILCDAHTPLHTINGVAVNLQPDGTAQVPAICMVQNACNFEEILIIQSGDGDGTPPSSDNTSLDLNCNNVGVVIVDVWAKDFLQQWTYAPTYIVVEDNYAVCPNETTDVQRPYAIARHGIAISFNEDGEAPVHVNDLIAAYVLPAGADEPNFAFSDDPSDTLRVLNCDSLPLDLFTIYAIDGNPNPSYVTTYYTLNFAGSPCEGMICCASSFSVINGFAFNLPPEQEIPLKASDFVIAQETSLQFAFSPNPADSIYIIGCEDTDNGEPGTVVVSIYGILPDGNFSFCETYMLVSDIEEYCLDAYNGPENSNTCNAFDITNQFGACEIYGHNIAASTQSFEPSPPSGDCNAFNGWCSAPQNTAWYYFEAPPSGSVNIYTSLLPTQIALWEANDCTALTDGTAILVTAESNADGSPANLENISCLIPGQRYYLQIDVQNGETGSFGLLIEEVFIDCIAGGDAVSCMAANTDAPVNNILAWQHFYNDNNQIVGSIANKINPLGDINFEYQTNEGPIRLDDEDNPYLDRNWSITVSNQPITPVKLRLYFAAEEFEAIQMADPNINTSDKLFLTRVPDGTCGPFEIDGELYSQLTSGPIGTSTYYIDFEITGFSAFYLNGAGGLINNTEEPYLEREISIFPNPTNGILTIQQQESSIFSGPFDLKVMNLTGQVLMTQQLKALGKLDLSDLNRGAYLLQIHDERNVHIEKIIIH